MSEAQLQDDIRLALGAVDGLCLWRNNIGVATVDDKRSGRPYKIRFGVGGPGGADLIGVYRGRFVAVEIKTPTGRQTEEQRTFQQLVERKQGIYVILRSVEDAWTWINDLAARSPK